MTNDSFECLSDIDHLRRRPTMYIGSDGLFGLIAYIVCPFDLLLAHSPSRIEVSLGEGTFDITSDATLPIKQQSDGSILPFESIVLAGRSHGVEGLVVNGLSESLSIHAVTSEKKWSLEYQRGQRTAMKSDDSGGEQPIVHFAFRPDASFFKYLEISPYNFDSYLRRLSFLHPGIVFTLTKQGESQTFHAAGGIRDLFESVAAPFQILHDPIHIRGAVDSLELELIFAYQSWTRNWLWAFVNNGRAVEGGPHEDGLCAAFEELHAKFNVPSNSEDKRNGVVAVSSIIYPKLRWEGCIKPKLGNPELHDLVKNLVVEKAVEWVENRPDLENQLTQLETFQFPEIWSS